MVLKFCNWNCDAVEDGPEQDNNSGGRMNRDLSSSICDKELGKDWSFAECIARIDEITAYEMAKASLKVRTLHTTMVAVKRIRDYLAELNTYKDLTESPQIQRALADSGQDCVGDKMKNSSLLSMSLRRFQTALRCGIVLHKLSSEFGLGILLYIPTSWNLEAMQQMSNRSFENLQHFLRTSQGCHHLQYLFNSANHIIRAIEHVRDDNVGILQGEARLFIYTVRSGLYSISHFPFIPNTGIRIRVEVPWEKYCWGTSSPNTNDPPYPDRVSMSKYNQICDVTITDTDIWSLRPGKPLTKEAMTLLMVLIESNQRKRSPRIAFYLPDQITSSQETLKFSGDWSVTDDEVHLPILLLETEGHERWIMLFIKWHSQEVLVYDPSSNKIKPRLRYNNNEHVKKILACVPPPCPEWPRSEFSIRFHNDEEECSSGIGSECDSGIGVLRHFQRYVQGGSMEVTSIDAIRHEYEVMLVNEIWDGLHTGRKEGDCVA